VLQQTAAAILVSRSSRLSARPPLLSWVVRQRGQAWVETPYEVNAHDFPSDAL
jgi:hypothetical protein